MEVNITKLYKICMLKTTNHWWKIKHLKENVLFPLMGRFRIIMSISLNLIYRFSAISTILIAVKDERQNYSNSLLVNVYNGIVTLEETLAVAYKTKNNITRNQQPGSWIGIYIQMTWNIYLHKTLYANFYNSIIRNSQKWKTMKISFNSWIDN